MGEPKNDIHVRNVYYAERSAGATEASEHAGRMSFVVLRQYSARPTGLAKIFQPTVEADPGQLQQRVTSS